MWSYTVKIIPYSTEPLKGHVCKIFRRAVHFFFSDVLYIFFKYIVRIVLDICCNSFKNIYGTFLFKRAVNFFKYML